MAKAKYSAAEARLVRCGWGRSDLGYFSRWFDKTQKRPGWACYMVSRRLAEVVQDYLDGIKAERHQRRVSR